jgi:hypothetical protein
VILRRASFAVVPLAAVVLGATGFGGEPGTGSWRTVPGPAVPADDSANLTALAMAGPAEGWAAGFTMANATQGPFMPLLAAWNGQRWRTVPVRLGPGESGRLDGLAAASAADAWAVGTVFRGGAARPLTLHWDGRAWTRVPAAGVPGFRVAQLLGVAARSPDDAWAVGEEENARGVLRPLIERWNGRAWRLQRAPDVGPQVALGAATVTADGRAWAAGARFRNSHRPLVLRWTGRAWVQAATPAAAGDVLLAGITAVNPREVWAVGTVSTAGGPYRPYAAVWNGRRWTSASVADRGPARDSRGFLAVTATGGGRLVAVGADQGRAGGGALYGAWNSRAWSDSLGPLGRDTTSLNAVASAGGRVTWAAGSISLSALTFRPVVQVRR